MRAQSHGLQFLVCATFLFVLVSSYKQFFKQLSQNYKSVRENLKVRAITVDSSKASASVGLNKGSLDVRIDDEWYDLSGWRKAHPSGSHWLELYKGRDATEVMHGFHSEKGRTMFQKLPKSKNVEELNAAAAPVSQVTRNFRRFRDDLEKNGWWNRDYLHEARLLAIWASLMIGGFALAKTNPLLAVPLLAIGNTASGWIGHDYIHGVDKFSFAMRNFAPLANGMSPTWWSDKHNKHHAVTNEIGADEDLATDPLLYVYPPNPARDFVGRKYQHLYLPLPLSLLFTVWRIDSAKLVIKDMMTGFKRKTQSELACMAAHYAIVFSFLSGPVMLGSLLMSGLITAIIVTVTHQSEELFEEHNPHFVDAQFRSTRNAKCANIISDWMWGGMQWQLEHHLFPSMPRSKYPVLAPLLKEFAAQNNLEYRITDEWDLIKLNWETYRKNSNLPASDSAKHFEGKETNWGGRGEIVPV